MGRMSAQSATAAFLEQYAAVMARPTFLLDALTGLLPSALCALAEHLAAMPTESGTCETTCKNGGPSGEPSEGEVAAVCEATGLGFSHDRFVRRLIKALDEYRAREREKGS